MQQSERAFGKKYRYNETLTGLEDIDWAKNIISQGYSIFYTSDADSDSRS